MDLILPQDDDIDGWEVFLLNLPDEFMSRPQKLNLMLMLHTRHNLFEPLPVIRDLLEHHDLWLGAVMDRGVLEPRGSKYIVPKIITNLNKLRSVGSHYWNVDTLFILTMAEHVAAVTQLAEHWNSSVITVLSGEVSDELTGFGRGIHPSQIIGVWWD